MVKIDSINIDEALRYMGYKDNIDIDNLKDIISECEKRLLSSAEPRYCYRIADIEKTDGITVKNTGLVLVGKSILDHLAECDSVILLAATLSDKTDKLMNLLNVTDVTSALITDAMASAMTEQLCDIAEEEIRQERGIKYTTFRFSPGYGDLPIGIQRNFIKALNADKKIGLTVNDSNILIPRKSVTAIIGISNKPLPKQKRGCAICSMNKSCQYKKRGAHCGI